MDIIKDEKIPMTSQSRFRTYLHDHNVVKVKLIKDLELNFEQVKEEYKKSKVRAKIEN